MMGLVRRLALSSGNTKKKCSSSHGPITIEITDMCADRGINLNPAMFALKAIPNTREQMKSNMATILSGFFKKT
jgi:hypothetical protein